MAALKQKGDLAEVIVAADLIRRGYRVAIPFGEDCDYDLVVERDGCLERVQVKHATSDGKVVAVRCYSVSVTGGKVVARKSYTDTTIDWLAVYDSTTRRCFYVPATELGEGRRCVHLRLVPPSYNRRKDVRFAADYEGLMARA